MTLSKAERDNALALRDCNGAVLFPGDRIIPVAGNLTRGSNQSCPAYFVEDYGQGVVTGVNRQGSHVLADHPSANGRPLDGVHWPSEWVKKVTT